MPTKSAVLLSTLGAVIFQAVDAGRALWFLPIVALVAALAGFVVARTFLEETSGVIVALGYVTPALILLSGIGFRYSYLSIWMAAFLGAIAAPTIRSTSLWRYPARLTFPLVAWALVIALGWPIAALRVLDWSPVVLWERPPTPSAAVYAIQSALWISHVATVQLLGLLWMDWLFAHFSNRERRSLRAAVITPALVIASTAAGLLSVYQGFVDLKFLSLGTWSLFGRATGAQADGNASGALTGLWVAIALCVAIRGGNRSTTIAAGLSAALLAAATYASGSRTAALCVVVALAAVVQIVVIQPGRRRTLLSAAAISLVVGLAGWGLLSSSTMTGPLRRISELVPDWSSASIRRAAHQLWEREGYGTAGMMMIKEHPLQGVGVGVFHLLTPDYVFSALHRVVPSDNAQNWFRHQLAELGLLGSIGWICWSAILIGELFFKRASSPWRISALAAKYTLVGFGVASLLGMPSQNLFVSLTIWTLSFWLLLTGEPSATGRAAASAWTMAARRRGGDCRVVRNGNDVRGLARSASTGPGATFQLSL